MACGANKILDPHMLLYSVWLVHPTQMLVIAIREEKRGGLLKLEEEINHLGRELAHQM